MLTGRRGVTDMTITPWLAMGVKTSWPLTAVTRVEFVPGDRRILLTVQHLCTSAAVLPGRSPPPKAIDTPQGAFAISRTL